MRKLLTLLTQEMDLSTKIARSYCTHETMLKRDPTQVFSCEFKELFQNSLI